MDSGVNKELYYTKRTSFSEFCRSSAEFSEHLLFLISLLLSFLEKVFVERDKGGELEQKGQRTPQTLECEHRAAQCVAYNHVDSRDEQEREYELCELENEQNLLDEFRHAGVLYLLKLRLDEVEDDSGEEEDEYSAGAVTEIDHRLAHL